MSVHAHVISHALYAEPVGWAVMSAVRLKGGSTLAEAMPSRWKEWALSTSRTIARLALSPYISGDKEDSDKQDKTKKIS